ncbi:hypothetical protein ACWDWO_07745 [Actinopolymorpha singaporensis]|nr:hypothetical protein [Actinopolymorpha singaporensis]
MLTLPLLVLTIAGVVAGYVVLPWSYEAQSSVVLLSSAYLSKQAGGNPYLVFDGSLKVTAEVVGREVMSDTVVDQMKARKLTSKYEVMVPPDSAGPVLSIDVTGSDPANVRATQAAVTQHVVQRLARIQSEAGVESQARIRISDVSTTPPTRQAKGKLRTLAMALFAGLVLTIVVPLSAEAMAARRRRTPQASTRAQGDVRSPVRPPVVSTHAAKGWSGPSGPARATRSDHLVRSGRAPVVPPRAGSPERDH